MLFGFQDGRLIALHAFFKKTPATPPDDLLLARKRLEELKS